jgi:hypothetical protein
MWLPRLDSCISKYTASSDAPNQTVHALFFSSGLTFLTTAEVTTICRLSTQRFYVDLIRLFNPPNKNSRTKPKTLAYWKAARMRGRSNCPVFLLLQPSTPSSQRTPVDVDRIRWASPTCLPAAGAPESNTVPCASQLHFSGPPNHYHSRVPPEVLSRRRLLFHFHSHSHAHQRDGMRPTDTPPVGARRGALPCPCFARTRTKKGGGSTWGGRSRAYVPRDAASPPRLDDGRWGRASAWLGKAMWGVCVSLAAVGSRFDGAVLSCPALAAAGEAGRLIGCWIYDADWTGGPQAMGPWMDTTSDPECSAMDGRFSQLYVCLWKANTRSTRAVVNLIRYFSAHGLPILQNCVFCLL